MLGDFLIHQRAKRRYYMRGPLGGGQNLRPLGAPSDTITYAQGVLAIANLLAYWKLDETSGTSAADASGNGYTGTYSGATLNNTAGPGGSMGNAPSFDGVNDRVTLPTLTGFSPSEGTLSIWCKVSGSGVWTDATNRAAMWAGVNSNNRYSVLKPTTNNTFRFVEVAGASSNTYNHTLSSTAWFHIAYSWKSTGNVIAYVDGSQVDSRAYTGTWSGTVYTGEIGAQNFSSIWWSGWLAHVAIYTRQLSASEITILATAA